MDWIEELYKLSAENELDQALDILFDKIDDLLRDGEFDRCNEELQLVDLERLDDTLILGILAITKRAKAKLSCRESLVQQIGEILEKRDPTEKENLMKNLI